MAQPRWVSTYRVDSMAMLSAYQYWLRTVGEDRDSYNIGELPIVMHRPADGPATEGTYAIECTSEDCPRCKKGWGGYVFRWFSPYWSEAYMKMRRREGCWQPGEEEEGPYTNPFWNAQYILSERQGRWP